MKGGVAHTERREQTLLEERIERPSGDAIGRTAVIAMAVIGFDIDARPKIVSARSGSPVSTFMTPCASKCAMRPRRATSATPATSPASMCLHHVADAREALGRCPDWSKKAEPEQAL